MRTIAMISSRAADPLSREISLTKQRLSILLKAQELGAEKCIIFDDIVKAKRYAGRNKTDALIVHSLTRLSRDLNGLGDIVNFFSAKGVKIYSSSDETPEDKLTYSFLMALDEYRNNLSS